MKPRPQSPIDVEVEDNDLSQTVLEYLERLRPHANWIFAGVAVVLLAIAASILVSAQVAAGRAQSWEAFLSALGGGQFEAFNEVIRRYPGTPAAQWSRLVIADASLAEGTQLLFADREKAAARLRAASDVYMSVMAERPQGMLAERAVFGLAKARESLGQLEEARRGYEAIANEHPAGGLARMATDHAKALGRESTRQWYDWFAAQAITPPANPAAAAAAAPETPADAGPTQPQ
jgi:hypothetical protein